MVSAYSHEETDHQLWRWLTAAGTADPATTGPSIISGAGSTAAPGYNRIQDGSGTNLLVVDSSGRITSIIASGPTGANALAIQGAGADAAAIVGRPLLVAGSDGTNTRTLLIDTAGRQYVSNSNLFLNITSATTTTVKSGAGLLHSLVINTRGVASVATVYDNTAGSGTKIATIDTTLSTTSFLYDAAFATGLTIVTTGTADITVTYR